jgi:sugar phosphate isomerase/epimerase
MQGREMTIAAERSSFVYTRREFGKMTLAGMPLFCFRGPINSRFDGVRIGVQSYSFRTMPLDAAIKAMAVIGIGECELFAGHVEPRPAFGGGRPRTKGAGSPPTKAEPAKGAGSAVRKGQEELRHWRLSVPMDHFTAIRRKFDDAGIRLHAYNYSFNDGFSDEEINRGFEMAKALGVDIITASSTLSAAKRVAPFANMHRMTVAMHGHDNVRDPNQFATPESFEKAMALSKHFWINLDIGHFFAAGYDPVEFIEKHHDRITNLHVKDRKKNHGDNTPWGEGDTPIKQVLQLLKSKRYDIPADIEYEYRGADPVVEVRKCFQYCKDALT